MSGHALTAALAAVRRDEKRAAMVYQRAQKEAAAQARGLPSSTYFDLPYSEWAAIR